MVIRKVLFDAFGTIFSPRIPVHIQYAEVGRKFGLQVDDLVIQGSFLKAYKKIAAQHPLYGKLTGISNPSLWWRLVIEETFLESGQVDSIQFRPVQDELTDILIKRFWSREGYKLHEEIKPTLQSLSNRSILSPQIEILPPGIVSGSDRGAIKVLLDLGVVQSSSSSGSTSSSSLDSDSQAMIDEKDVWTTWDIEHEKKNVLFWKEMLIKVNEEATGRNLKKLESNEILVVGDELISDYLIPKEAGFRSLLLQRDSKARKDLVDSGVECIGELDELINWLKKDDSLSL